MPVRIDVYTGPGEKGLVEKVKRAALILAAEYGLHVKVSIYRLPIDGAEWLPAVRVGSRLLEGAPGVERIVEAALSSVVEEVAGVRGLAAVSV